MERFRKAEKNNQQRLAMTSIKISTWYILVK